MTYYILVHGKGSAKGDFTLDIAETPIVRPTITVAPDTVFCDGDSAVLTSSPAVEYLWNDLVQSMTSSIVVDITGAFVSDLNWGGDNSSLKWDGKDSNGNIVREGVYVYRIKADKKVINGTVVVMK